MISWEKFVEYASDLGIKQEYIAQNESFFNSLSPDLVDKYITMPELPVEEVESIFSSADVRRFVLILLISLYPEMKRIYQDRNYSKIHFQEIKKDISLWIEKSLAETDGTVAGVDIDVYPWERKIFTGEVLQFGRLQCNRRHKFESKIACFANPDGSIRIEKVTENRRDALFSFDDEAINIHIPANGRLTREGCIDSLRQMKEFFESQKVDYKAVVCYSWILDPTFAKLNPNGNLAKFQQLGHIYRMDGCDQTNEVVWRVFDIHRGTVADIDKRPWDSSMRKSVGAYLKNGGEFCEYGLIILKDELVELLK